MDLLEQVTNLYMGSLYKEGKRLIQYKTMILSLQLIKGFREVMIGFFTSMFAFVALTVGVYVALADVFSQINATGSLGLTVPVGLGVVLALGSALIIVVSLKEKKWLEAFGYYEFLKKIDIEPKTQGPETEAESKVEIDLRLLQQVVDKMVEEKLARAVEESLAQDQGRKPQWTDTRTPRAAEQ